MDKKTDYKKIYKESFNDSGEFMEMYFNKVYRDEEAMVLDIDGMPASGLLLKQFMMNFHGMTVPVGYICGAATARRMRSHGYMSELLVEALRKAYDSGDYLLTLRPADRSLYSYYDRFGFTTVFYIQEERYTSAHRFETSDDVFSFSLAATDSRVRDKFRVLGSLRIGTVLFEDRDYDVIIEDNRLDKGEIVSAFNTESQEVEAIAVAVKEEERIIVRDILYVTEQAREAVLGEVKRRFGEYPVTVITRPDDNSGAPVEARGMGRIVNVQAVLEAIASSGRNIRAAIKVYDHHLPQNSHIYIIDNGCVTINDGFGGKLDLDVTQEVLTSIIFSAPRVGSIFNLPTFRPFMALMLE